MLFDRRLERAAEHIVQAEALLHDIEEKHPGFTSSIREHLTAAITGIDKAREEGQRIAPQVKRRTVSEVTSGILGALSLLLYQMDETSRRLEPLRPARETDSPIGRLERTGLSPIAESLGDLRRLTSRLEAELRLLDGRLEEDPG